MFSGEELKAKAPPVELSMIGGVIFFQSYRPQRRETGTQLKLQTTESTREGKMVNGYVGRRVNVLFQQHKVLIVVLGRSKPKWTNLHFGSL